MSRANADSFPRREPADRPPEKRRDAARQRRQFFLITATAVAIFFGLRLLPTGTNLNHMDFRVDAKNAIEFCDPLNPQFIPVLEQRSPVAMTLTTDAPPRAGAETQILVTLRTASGKPLAPEDLLVAHTRKLHLMIVDPTLTDYQHVHPKPGREKGTWRAAFTPRAGGTYRIFADFTPTATGRGLYASADLNVSDSEAIAGGPSVATNPSYRFTLAPRQGPLRAGQPADLRFTVTPANGDPVPLEPVMGAFAHLVAFDEARTGFAHLHPIDADLNVRPSPTQPTLDFKLTIPNPGRYVIWSQINLAGEEVFVPFWVDVI